jgi:hypothetical protein
MYHGFFQNLRIWYLPWVFGAKFMLCFLGRGAFALAPMIDAPTTGVRVHVL